MPNRNDYGQPGDNTALVPESLTVYRHFKLSISMPNRLQGMGNSFPYDKPGIQESLCTKYLTSTPGACADPSQSTRESRALTSHDSPELGCSCGFYAHYDPQTDFYDGATWTASPGRLRTDFKLYLSNGGGSTSPFYRTIPSPVPMVRSVVEMSGRVIMGRLGVRAQKMHIKAVAVDWTKCISFGSTMATEREVENRLRSTARFLGAKFYVDFKDMYKAYPKPDLSALGIEESKPKSPIADSRPESEPEPINYRKRGKNGG